MKNSQIDNRRKILILVLAAVLAVLAILSICFGTWAMRLRSANDSLQTQLDQLTDPADASAPEETAGDASTPEESTGDASTSSSALPVSAPANGLTLEYQSLYPDMMFEPVPQKDESDQKVVYLTFDDGPSENTDQILEILKKKGVQATFFVTAQFGDKDSRSQYYKKMAEDGHTIGLHTYSHQYKEIYASVEDYLADLNEIYTEVYDATGVQPSIIRFPGGSINSYNSQIAYSLIAEVTRRGFVYHDWVVSAGDAEAGSHSASEIYKNVVGPCKDRHKSVVLMHDTAAQDSTVDALPDMIDALLDAGYDIRPLDPSVAPFHFAYPD